MRNRNANQPLTNEEIQAYAPSAFAGQPWERQSDRYAFIPTTEVIDVMRESGFSPMSAQQSNSRIPGKKMFTKHMLRFANLNDQLTLVGDSRLEAILINSHDGTSRYVLSLGVFRFACLNGLVVAESLVQSVKIRHTGNIIEQVLEGTRQIMSQAGIVRETIAEYRSIQLSQPEQLAFANAARTLRYDANEDGTFAPSVIPAERLLEPRRRDDVGSDLWSVQNRVQENLVKGGQRNRFFDNQTHRTRRNSTRAITGIDQDMKLNKAIWQLAEEMKNLKK